MIKPTHNQPHRDLTHVAMHSRRSRRAGLSLLELTASTFLIGVCLVAALRALGAAIMTQSGLANAAVAGCLADDLLAEVLDKPYHDPGGDTAIQADAAETAQDKTTFDDVDDYHGWQESPPQDSAGQPIGGLEGWTRAVRVEFVESANPSVVSAGDTGVKRVTIEVTRSGRAHATRSGLRSRYGN